MIWFVNLKDVCRLLGSAVFVLLASDVCVLTLLGMCTSKIRRIFTSGDCLVGLVAKASASRAEDPGFESRLRWDFSRLSDTSDLKIATPVANLTGA